MSTQTPPTKSPQPSSTANPKESVAPLRKAALLLEARRNRVEWVEAAACPFHTSSSSSMIHNHLDNDDSIEDIDEDYCYTEEENMDGLGLLRTSRVGESLKSAVDVVQSLYYGNDIDELFPIIQQPQEMIMNDVSIEDDGGENKDMKLRLSGKSREVRDRIVKQLLSQVSSEESKRILSRKNKKQQQDDDHDGAGDDILNASNASLDKIDEEDEEKFKSGTNNSCGNKGSSASRQYDIFIQKLRSPEAAELVQGMRHFVTCFDDAAKLSIEKKVSKIQREQQLRAVGAVYAKDLKNGKADDYSHERNETDIFVGNEDAKAAAGTIHAYLNLALDSLRSHVLWKKNESKDEDYLLSTRNALESFMYQKIYEVSK